MTPIRARSGIALSLFAVLALTACSGGSDTAATPDPEETVGWDVYVQECLSEAGFETVLDGDGGLKGADDEPLAEEAMMAEAAAQSTCTDEWTEKYPAATVPIATK